MVKYASILVQDYPGTLLRILLVFKLFHCNIASLSAGRILNSGYFRITVEYEPKSAALESKDIIEKISKQINVLDVYELPKKALVIRELGLFRVKLLNERDKDRINDIVKSYEAEVIDASFDCLTIEVIGDDDKQKGFADSIKEFLIEEVVKTGKVVLRKD